IDVPRGDFHADIVGDGPTRPLPGQATILFGPAPDICAEKPPEPPVPVYAARASIPGDRDCLPILRSSASRSEPQTIHASKVKLHVGSSERYSQVVQRRQGFWLHHAGKR